MATQYSTVAAGTSGSSSTSGTVYTAGAEAALQALIKQLLAGGTPEQQAEASNRIQEIQNLRNLRADYSKNSAMADAEGAAAQQSRVAMEKLLPSINSAAEGAGTSASSMRALLLQDAANKAAESAAALKLKAGVDYGGISSNLSGVLANLINVDSPVTRALISALQISKGQQSTQSSYNDSARMQANQAANAVFYDQGPSQTGWSINNGFTGTSNPDYLYSDGNAKWAVANNRISNEQPAPLTPSPQAQYSWMWEPIKDWQGFVDQGNKNIKDNKAAGLTFTGSGWENYSF